MWDPFGCFQVERYILHELYTLDQTAREAFSSYQFNRGKLFRSRMHCSPRGTDRYCATLCI